MGRFHPGVVVVDDIRMLESLEKVDFAQDSEAVKVRGQRRRGEREDGVQSWGRVSDSDCG